MAVAGSNTPCSAASPKGSCAMHLARCSSCVNRSGISCKSELRNGMKETMVQLRRPALAAQYGAPFRRPRNFLDHRYVYVVLSPRAGGLSVGVNLSPTRHCNFDCIYCEVDRRATVQVEQPVDLKAMAGELEDTLKHVFSGEVRASFPTVPPDLLRLRHVALSGD